MSTEKLITYGVPQGSVLGPLLFSIYINSLAASIGVNAQMCADDTVLYGTDVKEVQRALTGAVQWCTNNV